MGAKQSQTNNERRKQSDGDQLQYSESSNSIFTSSRFLRRTSSSPSSSAKDETKQGKIRSRHGSGDSSTSSSNIRNSNTRNMGTLIVVNNPAAASTLDSSTTATELSQHPVLQQLNSIPNFNPILNQRTIKPSSNYGSWINEKSIATNNQQLIHHALEISPYLNIGNLYQKLVYENANAISIRQNKLTKHIKETDKKLLLLTKNLIDRQKSFAKYCEKLNKINDCTKILINCENIILNCKQTIKNLNDLLPIDDKLEPFVWGDDNIELICINSSKNTTNTSLSSNS